MKVTITCTSRRNNETGGFNPFRTAKPTKNGKKWQKS